MMLKTKTWLITFLLASTFNFVYAHEIAITFDDLPGPKKALAEKQQIINARILQILNKFNVPAIGFVNEDRLYSKGQTAAKTEILRSWLEHGQMLGNHTYSHISLNHSKLGDFENNVLKGAVVSKKLMNDAGFAYHYFRHPYLHTGITKKIRVAFENFLKKHGYVVAPVTIDTDDWKFNQQLIKQPKDKKQIIQEYLAHTRAKFIFYEQVSQTIFGRNIKHIWLLHVNLINSYALEDLLKIAKEFGYYFVPLEQALKDEVYAEPDNYYAPFGVSWLYRWDFTKGKVMNWSKDPETNNNPYIKTTSIELFDQSRKRAIPVITYVSDESKGKADSGIVKLSVVILSHGYKIKNTEYSFLAHNLAEQGYFVASIQHELPDDPELPRTGNLFELRKPFWQRGAANILFVIAELQRIEPNLDLTKVILLGHSNGGDISMFLAAKQPKIVSKVISLDSLRYPFSMEHNIPMLSIRANDTHADPGVLPTIGVTIVKLKDAKHVDMCDLGSAKVKQEIVELVSKFLKK